MEAYIKDHFIYIWRICILFFFTTATYLNLKCKNQSFEDVMMTWLKTALQSSNFQAKPNVFGIFKSILSC